MTEHGGNQITKNIFFTLENWSEKERFLLSSVGFRLLIDGQVRVRIGQNRGCRHQMETEKSQGKGLTPG